MKKNVWISRAYDDVLLNFSFLWLLAIAIGFKILFSSHILISILFIFGLGGHLVAPIFLLFRSRKVLDHVVKQDSYIFLKAGLLFAIPFVFLIFSWLLRVNRWPDRVFIAPLMILSGIYYIWNSWHFSKQSYGILQIYKGLNGDQVLSKSFDLRICVLMNMLVLTLIWFHFDMRDNFFDFFFFKLVLPVEWILILSATLALIFIYVCLAYLKHGKIAWPVLLSYGNALMVPVSVFFFPKILTDIVYSGSHWIQEYFLTAVIHKNANQNNISKWSKISFTFVLLICSVVIFGLNEWFPRHFPNIFLFGGTNVKTDDGHMSYFIACLFFSFWFGLSFLHFYFDRLIYKSQKLLVANR